MTAFTIIYAGGVARTANLSNDTRFPLAMDALPRSMSRRFPARDEDPGVPQQLPRDAAAAQINAILDSCEDADGVLADVQQSRGQSERSDESAIDNGTEFPSDPVSCPRHRAKRLVNST
jgi:hypothetical protein